MVLNNGSETEKTTEQLRESIENRIQQAEKKLETVSKKIKQSQTEIEKLAQRNVANSAEIRKIKENTDEYTSSKVRDKYDDALETQQRLFVMRGQLEKLKSDQVHLQDFVLQMQDVNGFLIRTPLLEGGEDELDAAELIESVIQAQEAERAQLSSQMHDGPAQALSNFILQAEIAQRLFDMDLDQAREELDELKANANATFVKVRDFIFELRPMMLDDLGLIPTLRHYIEALKEQNDTEIQFAATGTERRLDGYLEIMIFRAIQELVRNAVKHSESSSIKIHIDTAEDRIVVDVEDDGEGFNVDQALDGSMGIKVIEDRVEILKGEFNIDTAIGQGTRIGFTIPTATEEQDVFA